MKKTNFYYKICFISRLSIDIDIKMSERPTLYWMPESPPCRTIYAVAKLLGIEMNYKVIRLDKKEQMEPEFIKVNQY